MINIRLDYRIIVKIALSSLAAREEGFFESGITDNDINTIVDRYHNYLLALLEFKVGNSDVAEDLLQDTYLSFLKMVLRKKYTLQFENEKKLKNYLITIALNKVKDHYKKKQIENKQKKIFTSWDEMDQCFERICITGQNQEEQLISKEEDLRLKQATSFAMERLPNNYRIILDYKFHQGLENSIVGRKMDLGIKAVESLLYRAKQYFKKEFEKIALKENGF